MKNYVIIGGSKGIGASLVQTLASDPQNHVWSVSRSGEGYASANVSHLRADIFHESFGASELPDTVDGMAYLPGTINLKPFRGLKTADFEEDFRINVLGAVKSIQALEKSLKKSAGASVVLYSTVAVQQGMPFHSSIAAAKGAIEGLTRSLAAEFAPKIRVNCIAPSLTDTSLAERLLSTEQKRESGAERHPLKTIGQPEDIARISAFLLSDQAKWISGQVFGVDGGMSRLRV